MTAPALPQAPNGFGPWESVDYRTYYRAWKDDLPCLTVDTVHGDQFTTVYYIAHWRST